MARIRRKTKIATELSASIQILEKIGRGGMAEVYKGKWIGPEGFSKTIAIKTILPQFSSDKDFVQQFYEESRLLSRLSHPNIVSVFKVDTMSDGSPCLLMEWVDGVSLKLLFDNVDWINSPVPESTLMAIVFQCLKGLQYAHNFEDQTSGESFRIIHRDISPHNIMIDIHGTVRILDFGIAKALAPNREETLTKALRGKLAYLSPEMARGEALDERSDLFSLGAVAYELATGMRLFYGNSDFETIENVKTANPPPLNSIRKDISPSFSVFIQRLLAKNPSQRFDSSDSALQEIQKLGGFTDASKIDLSQLVTVAKQQRFSGTIIEKRVPHSKSVLSFFSLMNPVLYRRHYRAIFLLLFLLPSLTFVSSRWRSRESSQMIWMKPNGNMVDISPPDLLYNPEDVATTTGFTASACTQLCLAIATYSDFFYNQSRASKLDRDPKSSRPKEFIDKSNAWLARNEAFTKDIFEGRCSYLEYCRGASSFVKGFRDIASTNLITEHTSYTEVVKIFETAKTPNWTREKTNPYFFPDKVTQQKYNSLFQLWSSVTVDNSTMPGKVFIAIPEKSFPNSHALCREFGDMYVANTIKIRLDGQEWKFDDAEVYLYPATSSVVLDGMKDNRMYLRIQKGKEDPIFSLGVCEYKRRNGQLVRLQHWIPKSN